ncbi:hypothetical protein I6A62_39505 [Frankia sp. AgW1.1]|nr:hypothetical protein [Frankia sp. AgW1.1]MBL7624789.1 hypothetical protein [Frankia sp. AgB1.8]
MDVEPAAPDGALAVPVASEVLPVRASALPDVEAVRRWVGEQLARAPAPSDAKAASIVAVLTSLAAGASGENGRVPRHPRR